MGFALPIIGIASTALSTGSKVLGGIMGAHGQKAAIQYQMQVAKNNAILAHYNAYQAEQQGEAASTAAGLKARSGYGSMVAGEAASGVDVNSGSSVAARGTEAGLGQLDAMTIKSDYARKVYGYNLEAREYKEQRRLLRDSQPKLWQTILGAVTGGLGGAAQLGNQVSGAIDSGAFSGMFGGGGNSALDTTQLVSAYSGGSGGMPELLGPAVVAGA